MRKFLSGVLTVILMSAILVPTITNAKAVGQSVSTPKSEQKRTSIIECPVGEPNPITTYKTLRQAAKVAGFSFHIPTMKKYKRTDIQLIDKAIFEIICTNKNNNEITFRKVKGESDISGDYRKHTAVKEQKVKNRKVKFAMKNKKVLNATWYYKGYSYAIFLRKPMSKKTVISLVKKVN